LYWKLGRDIAVSNFLTTGDIVGEAPGASDSTARVADGLADRLADAEAEACEPMSALTSTFQLMPAALAMRAAPEIQRAASAAKAVAVPSFIDRLSRPRALPGPP
jgi:hypothetical protein